VQDTGHVTNATAIQGHLENVLFDCRHAALMTVVDEKRLRRTVGMLTAITLFPLGGDAMFNHIHVLTSGTTNPEEGHDDLHYRM
jgi:hypothetical protein